MILRSVHDSSDRKDVGLFVLDRRDGFAAEIVENAVHAFYFCEDPVADAEQQLIGDLFDGGRCRIYGVHCADDYHPVVGTFAVLDAGGLEVRNYGEVLPYLAGQTCSGELLAQDRVGLAYGLETVAGDGACAAHSEAGTGERLAIDHICGKTERGTHASDLILEEKLDGLDQFKIQLLGKSAHVMMGLDAVS